MKALHPITNTFQEISSKGFFHLLSANIFIQLAGFASQFLVAWILTPVDMGTIKLLQSYANIASIVASFGFNSSVLKLCSEERPYIERRYLYSLAMKYTLGSSISVFILFVLAAQLGLFSVDETLTPYFIVYGFVIGTIAFNNLQVSFLQALKKIPLISKIQTSTKVITMALIVGATYYYTLSGYIYAILIGSYLSVVVLYFGVESLRIERKKMVMDGFGLHWFYAKYSFLSNLIYQIYLVIDVILINRLISEKTQIGYYSFALMLIVPFEVLRGTVQQLVMPYFSEKANDPSEFLRVFKKYHRLLQLLSMIIGLFGILLVPVFISAVFKEKYDSSISYFWILIIAWVVRCLYSLKSIALWGLGRIELNFMVGVITLIPAFVISYYLIRKFGIIGGAFGAISAELLSLIITQIYFSKYALKNLGTNNYGASKP